MKRVVAVALILYVAVVVLANWLITRYGLIHIGFGLLAPAGTFCAALTFPLRDLIQRLGGKWLAVAAIPLAAGVSCATSSHVVAIASGVTFLVSETADFLVYTPLQRTFATAVLASSVFASVIDSVLFLHLAHIPFDQALPGLVTAKLWVAAVAGVLATGLRRVPALAGAGA